MKELAIVGINIDGVSSKLERLPFVEYVNKFDIVVLCELKCNYSFSIAGFKCVRSSPVAGEELRGGVAVLFKHAVWNYVHNVKCYKDQVWFSLSCVSYIRFGAVYIAPSDSPYFTMESFAYLQEECTSYPNKCLAIGDINARMPDLDIFAQDDLSFSVNPDRGSNPNGKTLTPLMLNHNMVPVNHMQCGDISLPGCFTYRKGSLWISQLDWVICHSRLIPYVIDFNVTQDPCIPSDHAAISITVNVSQVDYENLHAHARDLGQSIIPNPPPRPSLRMSDIDSSVFRDTLPDPQSFWREAFPSTDELSKFIVDSLYEAAVISKHTPIQSRNLHAASTPHARWNRILKINDSRQLWKAIDWDGTFETPPDCLNRPSDEEFCAYFTDLLNPPSGYEELVIPQCDNYVPILDDDIMPDEVEKVILNLKSDKAAGSDSVPPGLFKHISDEWLYVITFLFNMVFHGAYPLEWALARMFMIYKKGDRLFPSNYRGISIINAIAKIYDMVLNNRFIKWYKPRSEQAGAQKGRGCEEQILVLRLLISIAQKTGRTLYIAFVDFCKAYDKILRSLLLSKLAEAGCGAIFLNAIARSLHGTKSRIGSDTFISSLGVRQGAGTSCSLFTFYVDCLIDALDTCGPDGWLEHLHCVMQMDDTAVVAVSRQRLIQKLLVVKATSDALGQTMHPDKSRFFAINADDTSPIWIEEVVIKFTLKYVYLGAKMSDSRIPAQIADHMSDKFCNLLKFTSFLRKNSDAPFQVKEKVWNSCLTSSIMYGCETWLSADLRKAESPYMSSLKQLLGVRSQTPTNMSLTEIDAVSASAFIINRQLKYLQKIMSRQNFSESYVGKIISLARSVKCSMGKRLNSLLSIPGVRPLDPQSSVRESNSTRRLAYKSLNPSLSRNKMYDDPNCPEYARISATRMRLSSHRLKFEMSRWSRQPRDKCTCPCQSDAVQDEHHVLIECSLTKPLRDASAELSSLSSLPMLFEEIQPAVAAEYCHKVMKLLT